ncbi:MAG: hypothetical protein ABGW90_07835 [Martelella sp.]
MAALDLAAGHADRQRRIAIRRFSGVPVGKESWFERSFRVRQKMVAIMMAPVVSPAVIESAIDAFIRVSDRHLEMLDQVLDLFRGVPDYDLIAMAPDASRRAADTFVGRGRRLRPEPGNAAARLMPSAGKIMI